MPIVQASNLLKAYPLPEDKNKSFNASDKKEIKARNY